MVGGVNPHITSQILLEATTATMSLSFIFLFLLIALFCGRGTSLPIWQSCQILFLTSGSNQYLSSIVSLSFMTSIHILSFSNLTSSPSDTFLDELGTLFWKQHSTCPSGWCLIQIQTVIHHDIVFNCNLALSMIFATLLQYSAFSINSLLSHFSISSFPYPSTVYSLKSMHLLVSQDFIIFFIHPYLFQRNFPISQSGLVQRLELKLL